MLFGPLITLGCKQINSIPLSWAAPKVFDYLLVCVWGRQIEKSWVDSINQNAWQDLGRYF